MWKHETDHDGKALPKPVRALPKPVALTPDQVQRVAAGTAGAKERAISFFRQTVLGASAVLVMTTTPGGARADWSDSDLISRIHSTAQSNGALHGYWQASDNSLHVNFIDVNGHVHELYIHPGADWVDNVLTSTPAIPDTGLAGYWKASDNSQHVFFIDWNSHVHELYSRGTRWTDFDLMHEANSPAQASGALNGYWQASDDSEHVNFIDAYGDVHELTSNGFGAQTVVGYINPIEVPLWIDNNLTALAYPGEKGPVYGTQINCVACFPSATDHALAGFWKASDNSHHVFFIDCSDGDVHELYWNGARWADNDLTSHALLGTHARHHCNRNGDDVNSKLNAYWQANDNSQHVNFIDVNGHVHELYIRPGADWEDNDLTSKAHSGAKALEGLAGYWQANDNSQHVFFIGNGGDNTHLYELSIYPGEDWAEHDLTSTAHYTGPYMPYALDLDLAAFVQASDNTQHVYFIGNPPSGFGTDVHEMYSPPIPTSPPPPPPPTPPQFWTLSMHAGPIPEYLDTMPIYITKMNWKVTPLWNPALGKTVTITPAPPTAISSVQLPIPTKGSNTTVTVEISGEASTPGGYPFGFSVPPQNFMIATDKESVAFHGPTNETTAWILSVVSQTDQQTYISFNVDPIWQGNTP
jgi:hypothetical protein